MQASKETPYEDFEPLSKETSYEDFEPLCKWRRDQNCDKLEVHLQGFKRQQLKVEIHSSGILEISGERLMEEGKSKRIISRFRKEIPVSEDYQRTQIRAKFYNGILHLEMPKQIPTISAAGDKNNDGKASSSGTSYLTCLMKNKNIALEIMILAISLAIVGAYVKKYCQCSLE